MDNREITLLVGRSKYQSEFKPLPGVVEDLGAMQKVLQDAKQGNSKEVNMLLNPKRLEMKETIEQLFVDRQYRQELEVLAHEDDGEISVVNRLYLEELRNTLGLSTAEVSAIELEVLEPYRRRKENLQRYEGLLSELIQNQYPISEKDRKQLERLQILLKLRDEDIASIEERVLARKKAEYEQQRQEAERLKQQQVDKFLQQPELKAQQTANFSSSSHLEMKLQKQTFEFETATIIIKRNFRWLGLGEGITRQIERSRKQAEFFTEDLGNEVMLEMVAIPGGTFLMGSPTHKPTSLENEKPLHSVSIKSFFMGKFPVTQAEWYTVAGFPKVKIDLNPDPSRFKGANLPVERVSWYDAVEFCARLSQKTGRNYRLPSEAEWEYACRAGTTTPFNFGETISPDLANYNGKQTYAHSPKGIYREQTTEVGSFPPNAFGLYDMHGNVWEWCADHWHENYGGAPSDGSAWLSSDESSRRLLRGGSWLNTPDHCHSAYRFLNQASFRNGVIGFRIVCCGVD